MVTERPGSICFINFFDPSLFGSVIDRQSLPGSSPDHSLPPVQSAHQKIPSSQYVPFDREKASAFLCKLSRHAVMFTFDEYYLRTLPSFLARHWRFIPDPVPLPRALLESTFGTTEDSNKTARTRFLLFGSLGHRKGLGK